jgi:glycosyltransferase involved in cell wall biosynthesis
MPGKTISVITPCYNEEENVAEVYRQVRDVIAGLKGYRYEHIFIDNSSTDRTVSILKGIAAHDRNVKILVNTRNFGHVRSPMHAIHQSRGDGIVGIVADLQDPPEIIAEMVAHWEKGADVILAIKRTSAESGLMFRIRKAYYRLVNRISQVEAYENFTGFGFFDRKVVDIIKDINDPYPYFRGIIAEIGFPHVDIYFDQPARLHGKTKNNFLTLYDLAMLGITKLSKAPLRIVTFLGFAGSGVSLLTGFAYLIYKLLYWDRLTVGIAPLVIAVSFLGSIQLLSLGIIGEYIGNIQTMVQKRPFVFEKERVNFDYPPDVPIAGVNDTL